MVKVTVSGVTKEYETGITYGEVSKDFKDNCKYDIILAKQGAKLIELNKKIKTDCEIEFLDISDPNGHKTYVRGVNLLLLDAFYEVCKDMPLKNVFIKYMIGDSCYCEAEGIEITDEILKKVEEKMHELVKKDIPFEKRVVSTQEASDIFEKHKMYDKKKLFEYRRVSTANIYSLDGFEDYYYGYMPSGSGLLKYFTIEKYDNGFMVNMPNQKTPTEVKNHVPSPKLFKTLQEAGNWGKMVNVRTVGELNEIVANGGASNLILVQEALQEKKIAQIAEKIAGDASKKFGDDSRTVIIRENIIFAQIIHSA